MRLERTHGVGNEFESRETIYLREIAWALKFEMGLEGILDCCEQHYPAACSGVLRLDCVCWCEKGKGNGEGSLHAFDLRIPSFHLTPWLKRCVCEGCSVGKIRETEGA